MAKELSASVTLLLLLVLSTVTSGCGQSHGKTYTTIAPHTDQTNITIVVTNSVKGGPKRKYSTHTIYRGILIGAMRRLQETNKHFNFTYSENSDYGPYLESVNGLAGNFTDRTYWQLKVKKTSGVVIIPNVGIGCYIPTTNDEIIFNFTSY